MCSRGPVRGPPGPSVPPGSSRCASERSGAAQTDRTQASEGRDPGSTGTRAGRGQNPRGHWYPGKTAAQPAFGRGQERHAVPTAGGLPRSEGEIGGVFKEIERTYLRELIVQEGTRIDARALDEIRPVTCEVKLLPRTHGSALFTRGETQALAVTTLGTGSDEQRVDALMGEHYKKFMLHYNFPPYSVGEVKFLRGPGRREIGHGALG